MLLLNFFSEKTKNIHKVENWKKVKNAKIAKEQDYIISTYVYYIVFVKRTFSSYFFGCWLARKKKQKEGKINETH